MIIEIFLPTLLSDCAGGETCVLIDAETLSDALTRLLESYPLLKIHLYEETGQLRPHIRIFYNEQSLAWLERLDLPLHAGDCLQILQAVSGG